MQPYYVVLEHTVMDGVKQGIRSILAPATKEDFDGQRTNHGAFKTTNVLAEGLTFEEAQLLCALTPSEKILHVALQEGAQVRSSKRRHLLKEARRVVLINAQTIQAAPIGLLIRILKLTAETAG